MTKPMPTVAELENTLEALADDVMHRVEANDGAGTRLIAVVRDRRVLDERGLPSHELQQDIAVIIEQPDGSRSSIVLRPDRFTIWSRAARYGLDRD